MYKRWWADQPELQTFVGGGEQNSKEDKKNSGSIETVCQ